MAPWHNCTQTRKFCIGISRSVDPFASSHASNKNISSTCSTVETIAELCPHFVSRVAALWLYTVASPPASKATPSDSRPPNSIQELNPIKVNNSGNEPQCRKGITNNIIDPLTKHHHRCRHGSSGAKVRGLCTPPADGFRRCTAALAATLLPYQRRKAKGTRKEKGPLSIGEARDWQGCMGAPGFAKTCWLAPVVLST